MFAFFLALALDGSGSSAAKFTPPPKARQVDGAIEQADLSPLYRQPFFCSEHYEGQMSYAGDALGTDCLVIGGIDADGNGFSRPFKTDGRTNEDWYGWGADVLAPFDGVVESILPNQAMNEPGTMGKPPAGMIRFLKADGTRVVYGHVADIQVKPGDHVRAGAVVAKVGNNGFSRSPHIHVGAYRGDLPLQIRWDLRAMAKLMAEHESVGSSKWPLALAPREGSRATSI